MNDPVDRARRARRLAGAKDDALLLSSPEDVRWASGFTGSNGWLLLTNSDVHLLTDGRYVEQARRQVHPSVHIHECRVARDMIATVKRLVPSGQLLTQDAHLTAETWKSIAKALDARVRPARRESSDLRRTKSSAEIDLIRRAAHIADAALTDCVSMLKPGTTEREFRDAIESRMRELGADGPSYDTIVAGGPDHSAMPHHRPTDRAFAAGDTVVIDVGALVDGFHSDMTRTFFIEDVDTEIERWYRVLATAQREAVAMVAPGRAVREIDAHCRAVLASEGVERWFTHGLGHGVGLLIHENPFVNGTSAAVLRPGDVVTIEPGLYRGGFAGMRIEDLILVTDVSHEILTTSPKDPICPR